MDMNGFIDKLDYYRTHIKRDEFIMVNNTEYIFHKSYKDIDHFLQYIATQEFQLVLDDARTTIKDSGTRTEFITGAVRDGQVGKGRKDLLPMRALLELSKHFEAGAMKYEARNWEKGISLHTYVSSALNHLFKFMIGWTDEPHLTAAAWNIMCLLDTVIRIKEDKLPDSLNTLPIDLNQINLHWRKNV